MPDYSRTSSTEDSGASAFGNDPLTALGIELAEAPLERIGAGASVLLIGVVHSGANLLDAPQEILGSRGRHFRGDIAMLGNAVHLVAANCKKIAFHRAAPESGPALGGAVE